MSTLLSNSTAIPAALLSAILLAACSTSPPLAQRTPFPPCPSAPHCVSSTTTEPSQAIAPIKVQSMQEWQMLQDLLLTSPRTQVVNRTEHYLHAVSSTAVMRFKDDIELRYSPQQQKVDIRSSSRIGYYDFGVNRNRLEQLRKQFQNITANK